MQLVDASVLEACGINQADKVLVGLSGGADSVALLHNLQQCLRKNLLKGLSAAHLHHGIRSGSAVSDAAFCRRLCHEMGIPLAVGHVNVPGYVRDHSMSVEQAARHLRYAFLREQAEQAGASCVAVAHHAGDQAETILMHLIRGSARTGLAGMRMRNGDIVRPLLTHTRHDIEAYLAENGITYCTDETNAELHATRNRIRHELLPYMEGFNPRISFALCRMAEHMAADEDYFSAIAKEALESSRRGSGYIRDKIAVLPKPIQSRVVMALVSDCLCGDVVSSDVQRVTALLTARTGSCIQLRGGHAAWLENEILCLGKVPHAQFYETAFIPYGETILPGSRFISKRAERFEKTTDGFSVCVNAAKIPQDAVVRTRRDGDRFFPFGAPGRRLLSDYLTDRKCPRTKRDMPLLCDGDEVLWVAGYSVSERLRVNTATEDIMQIWYEEDMADAFDAR